MTPQDVGARWLRPGAGALVGWYGLLLAWLAVTAFAPQVLDLAPTAAGWLATPGSLGAMTVALGSSAVAFAALVATRWRASIRVPFLLSAWCAGAALPLAIAAYLPCSGSAPPFWDALSNSFALFLGSFERPFGPGEVCAYPVPLALQLARLLAILATLTGATSVLFSLYRSQLDRLAMLRARRLVAVIGSDESSWPVLQRLARSGDRNQRVVLLTSDPEPVAERARAIGMLVVRTAGDDPLGLREGFRWGRTVRCHLLSPDAATNRSRAMLLRSVVPKLAAPPAHRLTVVARIDDPWHADDFRKRFIGDPGFVFDAIGSHEATAESLVGRIRHLPGTTHLLLVGGGPLALALVAELSQLGRELQFLDEGAALPQVWLLDAEADDIVADHQVRQQRFATDLLRLSAVPGPVGLARLEAALDKVAAEAGSAAVVITEADTRLGTRLAVRRPELPIFELSAGNRPLFGDEPVVGRLAAFTLALWQPSGRSADAWERAARAIHERYRRRFPEARLAVPWDDLPREFFRESNRRQLTSLLDGMAALGRTWAPTSAETAGFDEASSSSPEAAVRIDAGRKLFDLSEAELSRLAEAEHESWRQHYEADGWRHDAVRDDRHRRHPDLLPWSQLDAAARAKTEAGVIDTLFQLRALGYRAVRPAGAGGWAAYRRVGEVTATRLASPTVWRSEGGAELVGAVGDWMVTDASGGRRTVTDDSFRAGHRHVSGDVWARVGTVLARPAVPGETIETQEGPVAAGASGWVVEDADGNRWIVGTGHFRSAYRPTGAD
ncbi:MAG: hypothetical protein IT193_06735 [Propionibacteriaceae bacterium]|nr:hypothetical protein [Propionibacteriaceae bacterium]